MAKLYIVVKEKLSEAKIEEFDFGVAFNRENLDGIEWLYFAKSKTDAQTAIDNLPSYYEEKKSK